MTSSRKSLLQPTRCAAESCDHHMKECLQCGRCCRVIGIRVVKTKDVIEYAEARKYTFDGDTMLIPSECPNLTLDNKCKIHDHKPKICMEYGIRHRKDFYYPKGCVYRK